MTATYEVRVTKGFSSDDSRFRPGDIIQGTFEQLDNYVFFMSDSFCIRLEYIDTVNIISCKTGLPIIPAVLVLIISFFFGSAFFLTAGLGFMNFLFSFSTLLVLSLVLFSVKLIHIKWLVDIIRKALTETVAIGDSVVRKDCRKHRRTKLNDYFAKMTKNGVRYHAAVNDASPEGLQLGNLPSIVTKQGDCLNVTVSNLLGAMEYRLTIKRRWVKGEGNMLAAAGFSIVNAPAEWKNLMLQAARI